MTYRKLNSRDTTIRSYAIKAKFPLIFWVDCCKCDGEFRREWGFKFSYSPMPMMNCTRYFCKSCTPTIEDAADIVKEYLKPPKTDRPNPRLPPRPSPPLTRTIRHNGII